MAQTKGQDDRPAGIPVDLERGPTERSKRRPYVRPVLQSYGALVDVTGFGGSQLLDSGASLQNP